jgi:hypothetical protein
MCEQKKHSNYSVKPTLKKVSKYENKFAKLQKKAAEFNFRNQLKVVKKKEFTLEEEDKEVSIKLILKLLKSIGRNSKFQQFFIESIMTSPSDEISV